MDNSKLTPLFVQYFDLADAHPGCLLLMRVGDFFEAYGPHAETLARETEDGTFTTAAYRDASGIGRNLTVDMLEYFDRIGFTRRVDDTHRRILRYAKTLFGGGASAT